MVKGMCLVCLKKDGSYKKEDKWSAMDKQKIAYKIWQYRCANGISGNSDWDWAMAEWFVSNYKDLPDDVLEICLELACQHEWRNA